MPLSFDGIRREKCLLQAREDHKLFAMTNNGEVRNPALCTNEECGLIFNFGDARTTYEAMATGKEVATNCPSCGKQVLYSEAFAILLAEAPDELLAKLARAMHQLNERTHFETSVLTEFYKELGRRCALALTTVDETTGEVLDVPTRFVQ